MKVWISTGMAMLAMAVMLTIAIAEDQPAKEHVENPEAHEADVAPKPEKMTEDQQVSYAIGMLIGGDFRGVDLAMDGEKFMEGFKAAQGTGDPRMTRQEAAMAMQRFFAAAQAKAREKMLESAKVNAEAGKAYLAENGKREGVTTTESGLQIETLRPGEGASPKATDIVTVHYKGTLLDGTEFDSSYAREEPTRFPLNRVIAGWTEGVQRMNIGGKYRLVVPGNLAYGENVEPGGPIGPNETLIFEVELLKVEAATQGPPQFMPE